MTATNLPVSDYFSSGILNSAAKPALDSITAFIRQSLMCSVAETSITIASGTATPTAASHSIDTEAAAASDDLANIATTNMVDGQLLLVRCTNAARVVTLKHAATGAGQLYLKGSIDAVLDDTTKYIVLRRIGADWYEIQRNFTDGSAISAASLTVTGTTLPSTEGVYKNASNILGFVARGLLALTLTNPVSAVNAWAMSGSATSNAVSIMPSGSDTNIATTFSSKGNGILGFFTNSGGRRQFEITNTAAPVNYWSYTGAATGNQVVATATGSDTDVGMKFVNKGAGNTTFTSAAGSTTTFVISSGSGDYLAVGGASGYTTLQCNGGSTNIGLYVQTKGNGSLFLCTATSAVQFAVTHTASAVDYIAVTGSAAGAPQFTATGSSTDIGIYYNSKGAGSHNFRTASNALQFQVFNTTSAVNYWAFTGSTTTSALSCQAVGSDTNIGITFTTKGSGIFTVSGSARTGNIGIGAAPGTGSDTCYNYSASVNPSFVVEKASGAKMWFQSAGSVGIIGTTTNHEMQLYVNNAARHVIGQNRIMVNTTTDDGVNNLQVNGSITGTWAGTAIPAAKIGTRVKAVWIPARVMLQNAFATAAGALANMSAGASNYALDYIPFAGGSAQQHITFPISIPASWNNGAIGFRAYWSHASTTTNFNVRWVFGAGAYSDDDLLTTSNIAQAVATDTGGTTNDLYITGKASLTPAGSPAANDLVLVDLTRDALNESGGLAVDARLHGVMLYFTCADGAFTEA